MKRLLILLCLIPFGLFGQKAYVRTTVTDDEVSFYSGLDLLGISGYLPVNNPTTTGTLTTPVLRVGPAVSPTIHTIDSISKVTGTSDVSFFDGADTLFPYIPYANRITLEIAQIPVIYYVSTSGSNANDGLTMETPWQTLAYAETNATEPGCTIALKKGDVFTTTTALQINTSGNRDAPIVWDGHLWGPGDVNATIQITADRAAPNVAIVHIVDARYVTFQYINIDGNEYDGEGIIIGAGAMGEYSDGVDQNDEHDITVQYCNITDLGRTTGSSSILARAHFTDVYNINVNHNIIDGTTGTGIGFYPQRTTYGGTLKKVYNSYIGYNNISGFNKVGSGAGILLKETNENIIIEHNKIRTGDGGGTDGGMGINLDRQEPTDGNYCPTNITIRYNDVEVSLDVAFYISIAAAEQCAMSAKIYYNRFYCTKSDKPAAWINRGTGTFTGSSFIFYNNTMVATANNTATFREAGAVNSITTLVNNIIVCTGKGGNGDDMAMESANILAAHSNNLYLRTFSTAFDYVAVASTYYDPTETVAWEATAKVTNPFTYSASDFHLTGGSEAINTGVLVTTIPQFDIEGNEIIGLPDMGAYESSAPLTGFSNIVTVKRTIGWDGATGTDHVWAGDANHTAQNLDLGAILPAKSRIIAIEVVCTEALVGVTDMTFAVGNASAGAQFIAALSCDELNEVVGIIDASLVDGVIMNWSAATNVWIGGDPTDNTWADMTAGKWTVYITYINYTQI